MSTKDDNQRLNAIIARGSKVSSSRFGTPKGSNPSSYYETNLLSEEDEDFTRGLQQWTSSDGKKFIPASKTVFRLPPAAYEIRSSQSVGVYFEKFDVKTEGLVRFADSNSDLVIEEITKFWERKHLFDEFGLTYKRGICLWGPAGSGKSSAIQFIMKDVISRTGIVLKFTHPNLFMQGMRIFREVQPDTPVVVLMEDIDSIIQAYCESDVLNVLDGVDQISRIVFLATTNYPEELGERVINRPSRFDKRFFIGYPKEAARNSYFRHLLKGNSKLEGQELEDYVDQRAKDLDVDLKVWVRETEEFSIAHLKELFVAVVIQGDDLGEALDTLKSMKNKIHADRDPSNERKPGFGF